LWRRKESANIELFKNSRMKEKRNEGEPVKKNEVGGQLLGRKKFTTKARILEHNTNLFRNRLKRPTRKERGSRMKKTSKKKKGKIPISPTISRGSTENQREVSKAVGLCLQIIKDERVHCEDENGKEDDGRGWITVREKEGGAQ